MEQNKPQTEQEISQQAAVRRQKLADLCEAGHNPFEITKYAQDAYSADLKQEFADLPAEAETGKIVSLAGRMMSKRVMGKASFAHLRDQKGDIQIFVKRDLLGDEAYAAFKKLDIGDIIGVKGEVFRTKMGEISVRISELTLLSKSLLPLPEKFHGLTDREARYRQRYVDPVSYTHLPELAIAGNLLAVAFLKGIDAGDVGDTGQHTLTVFVAQTALDIILGKQCRVNAVVGDTFLGEDAGFLFDGCVIAHGR